MMRLIRALVARMKRRFLSKRSTGDDENPFNYPLF